MKLMKNLNRDHPECSAVPKTTIRSVSQCLRQLCHWNSLLWRPLVSSDYQEYFLGGKGGRCVGLTNLPPSCADCREICKSQRPWTLTTCSGLHRECFILLAFCNILPVIHPDDKTDVSLTLWTHKGGIQASARETSYTNMPCVTSTKTITLILTAEKTSKFAVPLNPIGYWYMCTKQTFTSQGIKIHYVEKGDPTKPLMLFLHGYPEFWYSWRHQLKEFSTDYWWVKLIQGSRYYWCESRPFFQRLEQAHLLIPSECGC